MKSKKKLSVIILARNEEKMIGECLESISRVDEVVLVDSGSTDKTVEIAQEKGAKVIYHQFKDFADQRNFALSQARGDWVLYIDADERVTSELQKEIMEVIENSDLVAYFILRKNFYFGNNEWPYTEEIERLFKREALKGWKGKLHESPIVEGKVGELEGFLLHYTHRDLSSMVKKTIEWSKIEAELRFKAGHPPVTWWRFPRVMLTEFYRSYIKQGGWKVGTVGVIESLYQAFSIFVTYARLWEMQQKFPPEAGLRQRRTDLWPAPLAEKTKNEK